MCDKLPPAIGLAVTEGIGMATREVALVIHEGVQALDVAGPLDVFAAANDFLPEDDHYRCLLVARGNEPIRCSNGMWLTPDRSF